MDIKRKDREDRTWIYKGRLGKIEHGYKGRLGKIEHGYIKEG